MCNGFVGGGGAAAATSDVDFHWMQIHIFDGCSFVCCYLCFIVKMTYSSIERERKIENRERKVREEERNKSLLRKLKMCALTTIDVPKEEISIGWYISCFTSCYCDIEKNTPTHIYEYVLAEYNKPQTAIMVNLLLETFLAAFIFICYCNCRTKQKQICCAVQKKKSLMKNVYLMWCPAREIWNKI